MTHQLWQLHARQILIQSGHTPDEAHAAARLLLDHFAQIRYAALTRPDAEIPIETLQKLDSALQQLARRVPLPHLTGRAYFYGLELEVSPATLIPRPETELLVEAALSRLPPNARVADLGTGSGAIAIALKKSRPDLQIYATEISPDALQIAQNNALRHGAQIQFLPGASDWLAPLRNLAPLDAIVSNPPYIPAAHLETLQPEVRLYEPRAALDGGADGLVPYRIFAARGRELLGPNGFFAVELGAEQWPEVHDLFAGAGWRVEAAVYDLQNIGRVLVAHRAEI